MSQRITFKHNVQVSNIKIALYIIHLPVPSNTTIGLRVMTNMACKNNQTTSRLTFKQLQSPQLWPTSNINHLNVGLQVKGCLMVFGRTQSQWFMRLPDCSRLAGRQPQFLRPRGESPSCTAETPRRDRQELWPGSPRDHWGENVWPARQQRAGSHRKRTGAKPRRLAKFEVEMCSSGVPYVGNLYTSSRWSCSITVTSLFTRLTWKRTASPRRRSPSRMAFTTRSTVGPASKTPSDSMLPKPTYMRLRSLPYVDSRRGTGTAGAVLAVLRRR